MIACRVKHASPGSFCYLNNRIEQDHRGIQQRYDPMQGFVAVASASRCYRGFDEPIQYFRLRTLMRQRTLALSAQRREDCIRFQALMGEAVAA